MVVVQEMMQMWEQDQEEGGFDKAVANEFQKGLIEPEIPQGVIPFEPKNDYLETSDRVNLAR